MPTPNEQNTKIEGIEVKQDTKENDTSKSIEEHIAQEAKEDPFEKYKETEAKSASSFKVQITKELQRPKGIKD